VPISLYFSTAIALSVIAAYPTERGNTGTGNQLPNAEKRKRKKMDGVMNAKGATQTCFQDFDPPAARHRTAGANSESNECMRYFYFTLSAPFFHSTPSGDGLLCFIYYKNRILSCESSSIAHVV
jgi:hypothetical protein